MPRVIAANEWTDVVFEARCRVRIDAARELLLRRVTRDGKFIGTLGRFRDNGVKPDRAAGDSLFTVRARLRAADGESIFVKAIYEDGGDDARPRPQSGMGLVIGRLMKPPANGGPGSVDRPRAVAGRIGVSVEIPEGWGANHRVIQGGGPLALTTFGARYGKGGLLPAGGAEIEITRVPWKGTNLRRFALDDLVGTRGVSIRPGKSRIVAVYREDVAPRVWTYNVATYEVRGGHVYKSYLTVRYGDKNTKRFEADYERVLKSMKFNE